jgi:predicted phosphodiesterase
MSDSHGMNENVRKIIKSVEEPDAIIHCGDMYNYFNSPVPFYLCRGNHENEDVLKAIEEGRFKFNNFELMKNGEIYEIDGLRILCFGGNHSPRYFLKQKPFKNVVRRRHYNVDEFNAGMEQKNVDVIVSHECMTDFIIREWGRYFDDVGQPHITKLVEQHEPIFAFSGHHHLYKINKYRNTNLVSLPRCSDGYVVLDTKTMKTTFHPLVASKNINSSSV